MELSSPRGFLPDPKSSSNESNTGLRRKRCSFGRLFSPVTQNLVHFAYLPTHTCVADSLACSCWSRTFGARRCMSRSCWGHRAQYFSTLVLVLSVLHTMPPTSAPPTRTELPDAAANDHRPARWAALEQPAPKQSGARWHVQALVVRMGTGKNANNEVREVSPKLWAATKEAALEKQQQFIADYLNPKAYKRKAPAAGSSSSSSSSGGGDDSIGSSSSAPEPRPTISLACDSRRLLSFSRSGLFRAMRTRRKWSSGKVFRGSPRQSYVVPS